MPGGAGRRRALTAVSLAGVCAARLLQCGGHPLLHHPHADLPAHGAPAAGLQVGPAGAGAGGASLVGVCVCVCPACHQLLAVRVFGHRVWVRSTDAFGHQKGPRLFKKMSQRRPPSPSPPPPPPVLCVKRWDSNVCSGAAEEGSSAQEGMGGLDGGSPFSLTGIAARQRNGSRLSPALASCFSITCPRLSFTFLLNLLAWHCS